MFTILLLVGMSDDVDQIAPFDVEEDCLEGHLVVPLESLILFVAPGEDLHMGRIADSLPFGDSIGNTDKSAILFTCNADGKLLKQTDPRGEGVVLRV
jgi:hypothetical protein